MRIRIVERPSMPSVDGVPLDRYEPGRVYDVGSRLGALMLAEGWAEPVPLDNPDLPAAMEPLIVEPPPPPGAAPAPVATAAENPPNLIREGTPFSTTTE